MAYSKDKKGDLASFVKDKISKKMIGDFVKDRVGRKVLNKKGMSDLSRDRKNTGSPIVPNINLRRLNSISVSPRMGIKGLDVYKASQRKKDNNIEIQKSVEAIGNNQTETGKEDKDSENQDASKLPKFKRSSISVTPTANNLELRKRTTKEHFTFTAMEKEMDITNKPIKAKKHSTYFWNNLDPNFDTSTANKDELLVYI